MKPLIKEEDKGTTRLGSKEVVNVESKAIAAEEGDDSKKPIVCKDGKVDLQLDLEKTTGRDCATANVVDANKFPQYVLKHPPPQPGSEKAGSGACKFHFSNPSTSILSSLSLSGLVQKWLLIQCCFFYFMFSSSELPSFAHVSTWLAKWVASYGVRSHNLGYLDPYRTLSVYIGVFFLFYSIGMTLSCFSRYVAPLPGVVSVDGSALPTAAMQVDVSALV